MQSLVLFTLFSKKQEQKEQKEYNNQKLYFQNILHYDNKVSFKNY